MGLISSGGITSGMVAAAVNTTSFLSGSLGRTAMDVSVCNSGFDSMYLAGELISGVRAVYVNASGKVFIAMAGVSGRMPAVGVVRDNVAQGSVPFVINVGHVQGTSGMLDFSGYFQQRVFVGRSGQITAASGSWSSGSFTSGDIGQAIGVATNSGGFSCHVYPDYRSGGPLAFMALGF